MLINQNADETQQELVGPLTTIRDRAEEELRAMLLIRRIAPMLVASLVISACTASGALSIVTLGADLVIQAKTGKGLVDYALSEVAEADCRLVRLVKNESVCQPAAGARDGETVASDDEVANATLRKKPQNQGEDTTTSRPYGNRVVRPEYVALAIVPFHTR